MRAGLILVGGSARPQVELARRAEEAGFASVWSAEFWNQHPYAVLGAIAEATERIGIGTAIANAFTRSPVVHATAALDLDELSGGRMTLGLGSGTSRMNEEWYGVPFSRPAARMEECVRLLRALFAAKERVGFRFEGKFYDIKIPLFTRPGAPRAHVPILVAAVNRRMVETAGTVADGLVGHPIASRRFHRERTLPWLRAAEAAAERPAGACRLVPYVMTSIQADRDLARRDARAQIGFYASVSVYRSLLELHGCGEVADACRAALARFDLRGLADAVPDALVDEIAIAGTPDEARERLDGWRDLTDEPLLYAPTAGVPPERVRSNLDAILALFATKARGARP
ncbi:MAG TPA: LLM class flavin-dependent oxidoreductase [Myxococcota bacterium]|nr:LLM class flavin-dependent oxidoreductase [Myxococcota bacterium]